MTRTLNTIVEHWNYTEESLEQNIRLYISIQESHALLANINVTNTLKYYMSRHMH
uniref:Uncharacterized protein n=1 Tax=Anguilla anguilla TaxID=7936 RepID=A0A0E9XD01_ANGAN